MTPNRTTLESLTFNNKFTRKLPCDPETDNTRHQVNRACYSRVSPTPAKAPKLVAFSREAARLLDLDEKTCQSDLFSRIFTGNTLLEGMDPFAMCYGGHQFGNWAGQLGDGRAINLGEIVNQRDERWMLQLKGAGDVCAQLTTAPSWTAPEQILFTWNCPMVSLKPSPSKGRSEPADIIVFYAGIKDAPITLKE